MHRLPQLTRAAISEMAKSHDQIRFFELLLRSINDEIPAEISGLGGASDLAADIAIQALAGATAASSRADDSGDLALQANMVAASALAQAASADNKADDAGALALQALTMAASLFHVKQPDDWFSVWQA